LSGKTFRKGWTMAKSEQEPRKSAGSKQQVKKPGVLDKPGLPEEQLGKVAGGMNSKEDKRK
jgi:hypothetical protein